LDVVGEQQPVDAATPGRVGPVDLVTVGKKALSRNAPPAPQSSANDVPRAE
jgi:hypothetical protein